MVTLTEFLLARIAEDEADAGQIHDRSTCDFYAAYLPHCTCTHPARVLAECEAKRRIVESCEEGCECHASGTTMGQTDWDLSILRALALPYADHPDYNEAWRP